MATSKAVLGLVDVASQAETVVADLRASGFSNDEISVVFPMTVDGHEMILQEKTKAPEGALAGVGAGGALGGTIGLLAGIGALAIPGIGPIIAAGPIMAALSGIVAGAAFGGVAGGLIGVGIPEIEAKQYEGKIQSGKILVSVHAEDPDHRLRARRILERHGASHVMAVDEQSLHREMAA